MSYLSISFNKKVKMKETLRERKKSLIGYLLHFKREAFFLVIYTLISALTSN